MIFDTMTIRKAEAKDIDSIWGLLHAECKNWTSEEIQQQLDGFLLLFQQTKLLGVLFQKIIPAPDAELWVVVHPLYPEAPLREILIQSLQRVQRFKRGKLLSSPNTLNPYGEN